MLKYHVVIFYIVAGHHLMKRYIVNKKYRQYVGLAVAVLMYYIIHEGAHLVVALAQGAFRQIIYMGLGVQIDVFAERMSCLQMGIFCLAGPLATLAVGWLMVLFVHQLCRISSSVLRACAWYTSLIMLLLDPLYLGVFYRWVGGGDMNGIALLVPAGVVSLIAGVVGVVNLLLVWKVLYPDYTVSFKNVV